MILRTLPLLLLSATLHAAPYTAWMNDYTGAEAGTLLLWKFDEPTPRADSSGNGWSISSNANLTTGVFGTPGKFGQSYYADPAVGSEVRATAVGSAGVFNTTSLSVEFWFAPESDTPPTGFLFDKMYRATPSRPNPGGIALEILSTGALRLRLGATAPVAITKTLETAAQTWAAGVWQHVAVTYESVDDIGYARIYLNGVEIASESYTDLASISAGDRIWNVGNRSASGYSAGFGHYDNFRVSSIAYQYAVPEPSAALLLLPAGAAAVAFKRARKK